MKKKKPYSNRIVSFPFLEGCVSGSKFCCAQHSAHDQLFASTELNK